MSRKNFITLTVAVLAVAAVYFYQYRDWFRKSHIQIAHTIRPMGWTRMRAANGQAPDIENVVMFRLDHDYKLTSIKIIPVAALETNKLAHPVWELTSDSNSIPTQAFAYGLRIRGMRPIVKGAPAEVLSNDVPYRLLVQAGSIKGEHDFTITDPSHAAQ